MGSIDVQGAEKKIIVGNKNFTEQYIIGQLITQVLEDNGFEVDLKSDLSSVALRAGMESGYIDICAEYTGTAWMIHLKRRHIPGIDNNHLYHLVKRTDSKNQFIWLNPIWNNNVYTIVSWSEFAKKHKLDTLSDLAKFYKNTRGNVETFVDFEFSVRPDGLNALQQFYKFKIAKGKLKTGTPGASIMALKEHKTDIAMVFGTDASIVKYNWHIYSDDKSFFLPYDLTPYVRKDILAKYPQVADIINRLVATFPGGGEPAALQSIARCRKIWQKLNADVDIGKMEPGEVAHKYLYQHKLIK